MDTILIEARRPSSLARPAPRRFGLMATLGRWLERGRSRRQLRLLLACPHALADLGLTQYEADQESIKPFWR